ncbi:MAG: hypothetical protein K2W99_04040 [Chthoniobacterales bacterium]|nr:hypothetical protein [Chthoniobacterales bacterium]
MLELFSSGDTSISSQVTHVNGRKANDAPKELEKLENLEETAHSYEEKKQKAYNEKRFLLAAAYSRIAEDH